MAHELLIAWLKIWNQFERGLCEAVHLMETCTHGGSGMLLSMAQGTLHDMLLWSAGAASLGVIRVDDQEHLESIYSKVCQEVGSLVVDPKTGDFAHPDKNEKVDDRAAVVKQVGSDACRYSSSSQPCLLVKSMSVRLLLEMLVVSIHASQGHLHLPTMGEGGKDWLTWLRVLILNTPLLRTAKCDVLLNSRFSLCQHILHTPSPFFSGTQSKACLKFLSNFPHPVILQQP